MLLDDSDGQPSELAHRIIGRYALFDVLAAGGMATVHIGRLLGPVGFARTVAIKRLHPQFAADPEFVSMFLDEARMCARIRHPNVVPTLDVVAAKGELFLVMEYVAGESLGSLLRSLSKRNEAIPWRIAVSILAGTLHGLHAAHEAKDEQGFPLGLVHRDVSPQNILVGSDGLARVVDFGIAKASGRLHVTREGAVKGKVGYMAPEQMAAEKITRQADVYAASAVLWEALTGRRLFDGETEAIILARVLTAEIVPPSQLRPDIPRALDEVVMKALMRDVDKRYATAREMALALEKLGPAALGEVGEWLESNAGQAIHDRARRISHVELNAGGLTPASAIRPEPEEQRPSESIRPTAHSDTSEPIAGSPATDRRRAWKPAMVTLGVGAVALGMWAAFAGRGSPDAISAPAAPGKETASALAKESAAGAGMAQPSTLASGIQTPPSAPASQEVVVAPTPSASAPSKRPLTGKLPPKDPLQSRGSQVAVAAGYPLEAVRLSHSIAILSLLLARPALADPTPEARAAAEALFIEGKALVEKSELAPACERFAQSQKLDPQIGTLLYLATCHEQTGKTATAWIEFKDALGLAETSGKVDRVAQAKEGVERVGAQLARATLKVSDPAPGLVVRVNGREQTVFDVALPFDPGTLEVTAEAPGRKRATLTVELPKGPSSIDIELPALAPAEKLPPKTPEVAPVDHTLAFIVGGAGIGLGAVGFALGGAAWATSSSADDHCEGTFCTEEGLDGHDTADALAWASNVTLIAGGAALAAGVVLFFVYEPEAAAPKTALHPWVDPVTRSGGFSLRGVY